MYANYRLKSHENENRPKNEAKTGISWSKVLKDYKTQRQLKDLSTSEVLFHNFLSLVFRCFQKKRDEQKIYLTAIFNLILNLNKSLRNWEFQQCLHLEEGWCRLV